jgi:hypothetical protein
MYFRILRPIRQIEAFAVFEPLRDPTYFAAFSVHPEFHTLVWPNGADVAPAFLRQRVRVAA